MSDLLVVLVVILIVVVLWRGPRNLPRLGQALGRGVREARREANELTASPSADEKPADAGPDDSRS